MLMQRRKVLLPEPLEPMMLTQSPACAVSDTPLSTFMLPVAFVDVFDVKFGAHGGQSVGGNVQKIGGCGAVGSGAEQVAAAQRLVA
jgi:hypothetical protein